MEAETSETSVHVLGAMASANIGTIRRKNEA